MEGVRGGVSGRTLVSTQREESRVLQEGYWDVGMEEVQGRDEGESMAGSVGSCVVSNSLYDMVL